MKPTKGPRLGGSPAHQRLMLANLATSLFTHGRITTTEAKARRLRPYAEQLITKAKRGDLHNRREIQRYYRHADFCMVTSLHDGMNLVAKEYVAARDNDDGVLILSRFTGASHELRDALMVNPYDVEDVAAAIHRAVTLDPDDRRSRMSRMRAHVREHNIFGWAGLLLAELARIPREEFNRPTA